MSATGMTGTGYVPLFSDTPHAYRQAQHHYFGLRASVASAGHWMCFEKYSPCPERSRSMNALSASSVLAWWGLWRPRRGQMPFEGDTTLQTLPENGRVWGLNFGPVTFAVQGGKVSVLKADTGRSGAHCMEGAREGVRAVAIGSMVDLVPAQAHLLEVMPQHPRRPPRAQRHRHIVRLQGVTQPSLRCSR